MQTVAIAQATNVDAVIVITWDAYLRAMQYDDHSQESMLRELVPVASKMVTVIGNSPYDGLRIPDISPQIITYGDTPGQVLGVLNAIVPDCVSN
ncbi:MAG: hypothetical protein DWQ04_26735 [Chloroflexi bacterium]|nr:MAG: hypothetical protein DWQ04_26735 [Chloroflexota bacterium]